MKAQFNKSQLIEMYKLIDTLNKQNESLKSNYKNEGIECFYDKNNNFMLRYCSLTYDGGGLVMEHIYKVITPDGEIKDGKELFKDDAEAHGWTEDLKAIDIQDLTI
tara:strand:- start:205 stop:522 length:318 start_codon:yes stop_codon:yes gene_type:complete